MKKKIIVIALLVMMCCTGSLMSGCSMGSNPKAVADKFLESVQNGNAEAMLETIKPSEKAQIELFAKGAGAVLGVDALDTILMDSLSFLAEQSGLENCYIDDEVIVEDNKAVVFLKCTDYDIPYDDSKICLVKEDGKWYVTFDTFTLVGE